MSLITLRKSTVETATLWTASGSKSLAETSTKYQTTIIGVRKSTISYFPIGVILSRATVSPAILSWNCGEHSDFKVRRALLSFSFEISMTNSHSVFDLMLAGSLLISLVQLLSIAHGLNFLLQSTSRTKIHFVCS